MEKNLVKIFLHAALAARAHAASVCFTSATNRSHATELERAQAFPDGGHRDPRPLLPPIGDRHLARQCAADQPGSGVVRAVRQQPRRTDVGVVELDA